MVLKFLINLDNGRIVPRTPETDQHVNCSPISREIVDMIKKGEVTAKDVTNAIRAKRHEDPDYDWDKHDKLLRVLNVRRANRQVQPEDAALADRTDEEITLDEISAEKAKAVNKAEKKARVKKVKAALEAASSVDPLAGL